MKRFFSLLFVCLFLPVLSFSEDLDPIVGCWYAVYDVNSFDEKKQEEFKKNVHIRDTQQEIDIYRFTEEGTIYHIYGQFFNQYSDAKGSPVIGTWTKNDDGEYQTVISSRICKAYFDGDDLFTKHSSDVLIRLRKMQFVDFSQDLRKE